MSEQGEKESVLVRFVVILLVASFAVLPMIFFGCSPEWARWDASQANAFFKQGETSDALYQLRDAIRKSPRDPVLKLTLAERLIDLKKPDDALALTTEVLDVYPDNINAMRIKSRSQQRLGDFEAALQTEIEIDDYLHAYLRDSHLNTLAYVRALTKKDLHVAKEEIETAVASLNRAIAWSGERNSQLALYDLSTDRAESNDLSTIMPEKAKSLQNLQVKAIILAALVSRSCDARDEPLKVLSNKIDFCRERTSDVRKGLTNVLYEETGSTFPVRQDKPIRDHRMELRFFEAQLANLLSCRALLWQDLEQADRCQADRHEVRTLGGDSSRIVAGFPDDKTAMLDIGSIGGILDTRGFVCSMQPWRDELKGLDEQQRNYLSSYADALRDMDVAILCNQISQASFRCSLRNVVELSFDRDGELEQLKEQEAVLRYHRMLLHQRHGDNELATVDDQRIRDLGKEPGPHIY